MSIYKKLARIQRKLMGMEISKSGWNSHRKYHYYDLDDILPPIFEACFEEELTLMFNFTEDAAVLHLKSWNAKGDVSIRDELSVRVPFPELMPKKGMDHIQVEGSYVTYLKRYLLINLFLIMENDVIDSGADNCDCECDCKEKPVKKAKSKESKVAKKQAGEKPEKLKNAINLAKNNGGLTADNVCYQADMLLKKGVVSKDQSEAIKTYVHEHGVEV